MEYSKWVEEIGYPCPASLCPPSIPHALPNSSRLEFEIKEPCILSQTLDIFSWHELISFLLVYSIANAVYRYTDSSVGPDLSHMYDSKNGNIRE